MHWIAIAIIIIIIGIGTKGFIPSTKPELKKQLKDALILAGIIIGVCAFFALMILIFVIKA
jgi:multisubunit Na+/H+ antiporter MnhC subunit